MHAHTSHLAPKPSLSRRRFVAAALASVLFGTAAAQAMAGGALAFAQRVGDTAIADLTAPGITDSARVTRIRKMLTSSFDKEAISRFVLGPFVRQTSPEQFKEFMHLYELYVAHNYAGLFKRYNGEKVEMQRERPVANGQVAVIGIIRQPDGPAVNLEMRVHMVEGAYKIVDLKVEGVSMPLTHRQQFAAVINQRGNKVSGLIDALRGAIKRFEAETPSR